MQEQMVHHSCSLGVPRHHGVVIPKLFLLGLGEGFSKQLKLHAYESE